MAGLMTENLYLGAYALTNGASLKRVLVTRAHGRTTAVFELEASHGDKLTDEYFRGTAIVNLAEFREQLDRLRDELFAVLRNEMKRRDDHAEDRKRGARSAQAFR